MTGKTRGMAGEAARDRFPLGGGNDEEMGAGMTEGWGRVCELVGCTMGAGA